MSSRKNSITIFVFALLVINFFHISFFVSDALARECNPPDSFLIEGMDTNDTQGCTRAWRYYYYKTVAEQILIYKSAGYANALLPLDFDHQEFEKARESLKELFEKEKYFHAFIDLSSGDPGGTIMLALDEVIIDDLMWKWKRIDTSKGSNNVAAKAYKAIILKIIAGFLTYKDIKECANPLELVSCALTVIELILDAVLDTHELLHSVGLIAEQFVIKWITEKESNSASIANDYLEDYFKNGMPLLFSEALKDELNQRAQSNRLKIDEDVAADYVIGFIEQITLLTNTKLRRINSVAVNPSGEVIKAGKSVSIRWENRYHTPNEIRLALWRDHDERKRVTEYVTYSNTANDYTREFGLPDSLEGGDGYFFRFETTDGDIIGFSDKFSVGMPLYSIIIENKDEFVGITYKGGEIVKLNIRASEDIISGRITIRLMKFWDNWEELYEVSYKDHFEYISDVTDEISDIDINNISEEGFSFRIPETAEGYDKFWFRVILENHENVRDMAGIFNIIPNQSADITSVFSDIPSSQVWYRDYLGKLYEKGIIKGYDDGTFRPDENITRGEFIKSAIASLKKECRGKNIDNCGNSGDDPPEEFISKSHWSYPYVREAWNSEWLDKSKVEFRPDVWVTRAEVAKILVRALGKQGQNYSETSRFTDVNGKTQENGWFYDAAYICQNERIFEGYKGTKCDGSEDMQGKTYFCPEKNINRAEVVKVICRAFFSEEF